MSPSQPTSITDVWADNLASEMLHIARLAGSYAYIALDTEFPGVVARPVGTSASIIDAGYQTLRCNVNMLRMIQLGLSVCSAEGAPVRCWQFNFLFSKESDMYAEDSIDLLESSGLDFGEHERRGITVEDFGELLTSSGLVLNEEVSWVSFHGGYDFAYLLKMLSGAPLPEEEVGFFELLECFFPQLYDLKYLMRRTEGAALYGGLNRLAEHYDVERVGKMHQAGSDSLLTLRVFFRMRGEEFGGAIDEELEGILFGLGAGGTAIKESTD